MHDVTVIIPVGKSHRAIYTRAIRSADAADCAHIIYLWDGADYYTSERYKGDCGDDWYTSIWIPTKIGVCAARNLAIQHAPTELIIALDADDELVPNGIQAMLSAYRPGTWVYGNYEEHSERGVELVNAPAPEVLCKKPLTYATMLFAKSDWERVGRYDLDFNLALEDYAFQCALTHHGVKPVKVDETVFIRHIEDSSGRSATALKYWSCLTRLMKEKWPEAFR